MWKLALNTRTWSVATHFEYDTHKHAWVLFLARMDEKCVGLQSFPLPQFGWLFIWVFFQGTNEFRWEFVGHVRSGEYSNTWNENVTKIHSQETTSLGDMRTWAAMCWTPYPNTYHGGCRENSTSYKFYCWVITIQPCQTNSKTLISIHVLMLLQIANHHALRKMCNHVTPHYFTDIPCNYEYLLPQQHHERERERESPWL